MSKDTSSAHATNPAGNPAALTLSQEHLGILEQETRHDPRYIANHTIDPETGMIESNGFPDAFDGTRKLAFIQALRSNSFKFEMTCKQFGVSPHTVYKHKRIDPEFHKAMQAAIQDYTDSLEWFSMGQAFEPKATLERIFQLRALRPEKYAREQSGVASTHQVILNISGFPQEKLKQRDGVIDVSTVKDLDAPPDDLQITMHNPISPSTINSSSEPLPSTSTEPDAAHRP